MESFSGCNIDDVIFEDCSLESLDGLPRVVGINFSDCSVKKSFNIIAARGSASPQLVVNKTDLKGSVFDGFYKVMTDSDSTGTFEVRGQKGEIPVVYVISSGINPIMDIKTVITDSRHSVKAKSYIKGECKLRLGFPGARLDYFLFDLTEPEPTLIFDRHVQLGSVKSFLVFPGEVPSPLSSQRILVHTPDGLLGELPGLVSFCLNGLVQSVRIPILEARGSVTMGLSPASLKELRLPTMSAGEKFKWTLDFVPDVLRWFSPDFTVVPNPGFHGDLWLYGDSCPSWDEIRTLGGDSWLWDLFKGLIGAGYNPNRFYLRGKQCPEKFFESLGIYNK